MNHYAQALAELQAQPDHELKQIGDQWQTPKALAWGLFHQFAPTLGPVVLDMFADDCNALVPNWSPWWLVMAWCAIIVIIGGSLYQGSPHHEPGVRHALPDPHVPQCYSTEWRSGQYCEFRPVTRHYKN